LENDYSTSFHCIRALLAAQVGLFRCSVGVFGYREYWNENLYVLENTDAVEE
jgi:hypothetical protein